ncbi:MAG: Uncharacterised protein [Flavobacterium sp. SCGC AAA160-P02]|nr:MAG: Uncharacterised protein [Flavobacterium sp. SCGC AAA160-P02]
MNHQHMYKFIISFFFLFIVLGVSAQQDNDSIPKDSVIYKTNYGLRGGVDLSKPIRSLLQDYSSGFEIVGDYRISKKWYLAAELGTEEFTTKEDFTNFTSKGSYIKMGLNFNSYKNWLDMNNEIFIGFRYGFATFNETLNSYQINTGNSILPTETITTPITEDGLTAHWAEIQIGFRAEIHNNIFISFSSSYKIMVSNTNTTNFKIHYAPGFNRIYASNTGFGFNYTISYLIPFRKK